MYGQRSGRVKKLSQNDSDGAICREELEDLM